MKVWIVESRLKTEYGWSDWEPTWDHDSGPYDTASMARKKANILFQLSPRHEKWQFRAAAYERKP